MHEQELAELRRQVTAQQEELAELRRQVSAQQEELARLRESEERYRTLVESACDYIFVLDAGCSIRYVNPFAAQSYGRSREWLSGRHITELFGPSESSRQIENVHRVLREGRDLCVAGDHNIQGKQIWLQTRLAPILGPAGEPVAVAGISRDVTELHHAFDALRESEARYRGLFNAAFDGVMLHENGVILDLNESLGRMLGYTREELIGKSICELTTPEATAQLIKRLRQGSEDRTELAVFHKDGTHLTVEICSATFVEQGRHLRLVTLRDLTEQKKLREELLKSEKLEAIGLLAGGIAHDFNNILTAVLGNVTLARLDGAGSTIGQERLDDAEKAIQRASELTQQLLTFARGGSPVRKAASLGDVVTESARFALRGSRVRCQVDVAADLWPAHADASQIGRVIQNMVLNADQAMPEGGLLHIRCANVEVEPGWPLPLAPGQYVRISLEDQGIGIPEEHLGRIFDPYFTTKEHGTGLGLATCFSIVRGHEGHIAVESRPGQGATFHVYLPALPDAPRSEPELRAQSQPGRGRVLLLDDEPAIRSVVTEMLQLAGYEVAAAADGAEAVALYRRALEEDRGFAAAILDLTIPGGMGGLATLRQLQQLDPHVRAIASSGYSNDPVMAEHEAYGFAGVLTKPYTYPRLTWEVQKVLARGDAAKPPVPLAQVPR